MRCVCLLCCKPTTQAYPNRSLEAVGLLQTVADAATAGSAYALVHYNLGVLLAEAGQLDKAMAHARMALEAASGPLPVAVSVLANDDQGAAAKRKQLVTLCLVLCALLMTARQQHAAALRLLAACPAPDHEPADASGVEPLHMCEVLLARTRAQLCASHLGDEAAAMAMLVRLKKRCVSAVAGGERAHTQAEMRATVWQDLALLCATARDHAHAHVCVAQALTLCPWQARSHCVLGQVHEASGGASEAMEAYNTALALEPTCAPALLKLGTMYLRRGTPPDVAVAHELLSDCLRYDASSAAAWFQLGLAARALGHSAESEATLATAVGLARSQPALPFSGCPLLLRV